MSIKLIKTIKEFILYKPLYNTEYSSVLIDWIDLDTLFYILDLSQKFHFFWERNFEALKKYYITRNSTRWPLKVLKNQQTPLLRYNIGPWRLHTFKSPLGPADSLFYTSSQCYPTNVYGYTLVFYTRYNGPVDYLLGESDWSMHLFNLAVCPTEFIYLIFINPSNSNAKYFHTSDRVAKHLVYIYILYIYLSLLHIVRIYTWLYYTTHNIEN